MKNWKLFISKFHTEDDHTSFHPLWAHIMDVFHVANLLWERTVNTELREAIAESLSQPIENTGILVSSFIGLHDIGKATPHFQRKDLLVKQKLSEAGFQFSNYQPKVAHFHSLATAGIIEKWLMTKNWTNLTFLPKLSHYLAIHHGEIYTNNTIRSISNDEFRQPLGNDLWFVEQVNLIDYVLNLVDLNLSDLNISVINPEKLFIQIAGLATLADWIGSMEEFFPYINDFYNPEDYFNISLQNAVKALEAIGMFEICSIIQADFRTYFPSIETIRPLQTSLSDLKITDNSSLTIIEAPTGEGKTEAAFYLAARQQSVKNGSGVFVAMPTQATSNSLYARFKSFLEHSHNLDDSKINVKLVHGNSFLYDFSEKISEITVNNSVIDEDNEAQFIGDWFQPKKRSLLAPYGVGTVDQVFLSVLSVKHFFLRLYALTGKTIIFDEVHAYDVYMNELLIKLIKWLRVLNCKVIILSATLPIEIKKHILKAWGTTIDNSLLAPYPLITDLSDGIISTKTFNVSTKKDVNINLLFDNFDDIAVASVNLMRSGFKVAIILNTISRTQNLFSSIQKLLNSEEILVGSLKLFHSRFIYKDRLTIENEVLNIYGPTSAVLNGSICIATQVIEQSLDLDFDVMYSDIAPIDLLIQRSGRIHRHGWKVRPDESNQTILNIIVPESDGLLPDFSNVSSVYQQILIYKTYLKIKEQLKWQFPDDYRNLIESVYSGKDLELPENICISDDEINRINRAIRQFNNDEQNALLIANNVLIPSPENIDQIFIFNNFTLFEDDTAHRDLRAMTRLGDETMNLIILFGCGDTICFDMELQEEINFRSRSLLSREMQIKLLSNSIKFSTSFLFSIIRENQPEFWQKITKSHPMLKYHYLLIFEQNECILGNYKLFYDNIHGLIINKQED